MTSHQSQCLWHKAGFLDGAYLKTHTTVRIYAAKEELYDVFHVTSYAPTLITAVCSLCLLQGLPVRYLECEKIDKIGTGGYECLVSPNFGFSPTKDLCTFAD